jgi:hypothetical protein
MRKKAHRHRSENVQSESRRRINRELREQKGITRRIPYVNLRKAIRRGLFEYAESASQGKVRVLTPDATKGPIRLRIELPRGPAIEPELRLEKDGIEIVLDDLLLSNYLDLPQEVGALLSGTTLVVGGPLLDARTAVVNGLLHVEPIRIPYQRFRAVLFHVSKKVLPAIAKKYVDARFSFSDPDYRIAFSGTKTVAVKFEGNLVFGEEHVVLQVSLQRLAIMATPIVASQLDAQLAKWTDGWDDEPSS